MSGRTARGLVCIAIVILPVTGLLASDSEQGLWKLHTIDSSSRGADGVRLGDIDRDGRLDVVTGWEEGGRIRVCFQPKQSDIRQPWPSIEAGKVKSPEDAVFVDVNHDGWLDVVSSCEGSQQAVFFHLNPGTASVRNASLWNTQVLPESEKMTRWMFCEPIQASDGTDLLIFGSKQPSALICEWELNPAQRPSRFRQMRPAGWIMTLRRFDVDSDGDDDIVYSDRKGQLRSVGWIEQVADALNGTERQWQDHTIGGAGLEVMFLDIVRSRGDAAPLLACNTRNGHILLMSPTENIRKPWSVRRIAHPENSGAGKAVAIGDLNSDGRFDLACTCGLAKGKRGVYWLSEPDREATTDSNGHEVWELHDISGEKVGEKFDRIELLDLDQDGDLDLMTCEERDNLGVIWYENPAK